MFDESLGTIYCNYIAECASCSGYDGDGAPYGNGCNAMFEWVEKQLEKRKQRNRLYWTNIPGITQPENKGLVLNDFLVNGYSDRIKARTLLESDSRPLTTPIKMAHRYFNTGFTTLIFKSKDHFENLKLHFDANFKGKSAKKN